MLHSEDIKELITELNKPWANNRKKKAAFFDGYSKFSERIRRGIRKNLDIDFMALLSHYREAIAKKNYDFTPLNKAVIEYQICRQAYEMSGDGEAFRQSIRELQSNDFKITLDDWRSCFFLAHQHALSPLGIAQPEGALSVLQNIKTTKATNSEVEEHLFRLLHDKMRPINPNKEDKLSNDFNNLLSNPQIRSAICLVHMEIMDNVEHWAAMGGGLNKNLKENNKHLFGDTLIMGISFHTVIGSQKQPNRRNVEEHTQKYMQSYVSEGLANSGQLTFLQIEYFDNGRGIVENLRNFGQNYTEGTTLLDAIKSHMTSRPSKMHSGHGFTNIIKQAKEHSGFFCLTSGNERVLYVPTELRKVLYPREEYKCHEGEEPKLHSENLEKASFEHGTHTSVLFPLHSGRR